MNTDSRIDHGHTTDILDEEGDLLTLTGKDADLHRMDRTVSTPTIVDHARLAITTATIMATDNHDITTICLMKEKEKEKEDLPHNITMIHTLEGLLYLTHPFLHDRRFPI